MWIARDADEKIKLRLIEIGKADKQVKGGKS